VKQNRYLANGHNGMLGDITFRNNSQVVKQSQDLHVISNCNGCTVTDPFGVTKKAINSKV